MEVDKERNWYLLQVKTNCHERALYNLQEQKYECYSPTVSIVKNQFDGTAAYIEPLFPGYIFVKLEYECNWTAISSTRGVNKFVSFGGYPHVVSEAIIDSIKEKEDCIGQILARQHLLEEGDFVEIVSLDFENLNAVFKCHIGKHRSLVLINYLGRQCSMIVNQNAIRKINSL